MDDSTIDELADAIVEQCRSAYHEYYNLQKEEGSLPSFLDGVVAGRNTEKQQRYRAGQYFFELGKVKAYVDVFSSIGTIMGARMDANNIFRHMRWCIQDYYTNDEQNAEEFFARELRNAAGMGQ